MTAPLLYVDHFWISPYAFSCFVALREKGIVFDTKHVSIESGEQRSESYAHQTVLARVPALVHGDFVLSESSAMIEYIEEAFASNIHVLPKNTQDRARARQIMSWIRSDDTLPIREERGTHTMFYDRATTPLSDRAKAAAAKLVAIAERFTRGDCLFEEWCIADADLAFMLQRLIRNEDPVPTAVRAYAERQWKRASVQEFVDRKRAAYVPY